MGQIISVNYSVECWDCLCTVEICISRQAPEAGDWQMKEAKNSCKHAIFVVSFVKKRLVLVARVHTTHVSTADQARSIGNGQTNRPLFTQT